MPVPPFLNNLAGLNAVASAKGGVLTYLNEINALNSIDIIESGAGGYLNGLSALNSIDVLLGGSGGYLNELDALNSIVVLEGGVGNHLNTIDAINEWVDNSGGFTGILDIVTGALLAYAPRRLTGTSWGIIDGVLDPLIRLREDAGTTEKSFSYDANGDLDTAAIETWRMDEGATNLYYAKYYDPIGSNHAIQTTLVQQPLYRASDVVFNSKPVPVYDGIDDVMGFSALSLSSFTVFICALWRDNDYYLGDPNNRTKTESTSHIVMRADGNVMTPATIDVSLSEGNGFVLASRRNGTAMEFYHSDTQQGTATLSGTWAPELMGAATAVGAASLNGPFSEIIVYPSALARTLSGSDLTAGDLKTVLNDIETYYGL